MTTNWTIAAIGSSAVHAAGTAPTLTEAWTAALTAARAGLLAGELDSLAVSIDGQLDALYTPGRDASGALDPSTLTAALVDLHQAATADELADQLITGGRSR